MNQPVQATAPSGERVLTHLFFTADFEAHDRSSGASLVVAILLHLLLLFLAIGPVGRHLRKTELDAGVGTGIGAGAAGGGGGGSEQVSMIDLTAPTLPEPAAPVVVPPPPPPPPPELTLIAPTIAPPMRLALTAVKTDSIPGALSSAGGQGTGTGPGRGPGMGPGSGGGSGGGEGGGIGSGIGPGIGRGRVLSPQPDFMLLPPTPTPGGVRGKTVVVRLAIDVGGGVNEVELIPSTGDRGYDQALRRTAMGWHFRPARDASNRAVAVTYDISFVF